MKIQKAAFPKILRDLLMLGLLMIFCLPSIAQKNMQDVVYLKNGSIIRGQIVAMNTAESVTIEVMGGSTFVYPMDEVDRITTEASKYKKPKQEISSKKKGYFNTTEIGVNLGTPSGYYYQTMSGFSVHNINGYYFNRFLGVGAGIGIDYYGANELPITPIYLRVEGQLLSARITPVYFMETGYGLPWMHTRNEYTTIYGGMMFNAGVGIRFNTASKVAWQLSVGYKTQRKEEITRYEWDVNSEYKQTNLFKRLTLKVGMTF